MNIKRINKKRVVIVGGGFGGLQLVKDLINSELQVVLIDRNNYHQFQPLIYQVASAGLAPNSISFPFRQIFKNKRDFFFRNAEVTEIIPEKKIVKTTIGDIDYDFLVLATGATTNFFGMKNIQEWAIPMRTLSEAMGLRNTLLTNLEKATNCNTEEERQELLNIVVVGGGATGVEIAGAISEMKTHVVPYDYPDLDPQKMHIYLLEAGNRLLAGMSEKSSNKTLEFLQDLGVDVQLEKRVTDYVDNKVIIQDGSVIPTQTLIWVSGVRSEIMSGIDPNSIERNGRIKVDSFNRAMNMDNIFVIGDQCIMYEDKNYPLGHPQLAQVAIQQAHNLSQNIKSLSKGDNKMKPFKYKDLGAMATIGRNKAVADIGKIKMQGSFAWLLWLLVHLRSILGVRNKLMVLLSWIWQYFSYAGSVRTIVYATKPKILRKDTKIDS